jgi:hypothetical protein
VIPTHSFQETPRRHAAIRGGWIVVGLAIACLATFAPRAAFAQASAGITGTVTDPSGAVIAGVQVTITNDDTGVVNKVVTGSAGTYILKGLTPGRYDVTFEATGFKTGVKKDVTVVVSTNDTIDFTLTTGSASETVSVSAEQIALNTTQPELGSTIESVVVEALPEEVSGRGRQIDQLQFLAPGTTGGTFSHRVSGGADFSQEIVYNGIPVPQSETEGYTTNYNPPFDMVQEYKVERSTFSAQFGLGQGALTYQMHSGTNQYHGSLFEINRNSLFDSVGFFNGHAWNSSNPNDKPPVDHENNYGFSVGGPIRIPHLYNGHNKTFGFYSQEWYKQNNQDTDIGTVPTAAEKTGDFTNLLSSSGATVPIYDPTTGQQFECNGVKNVICPDRFSPISQSLLQYIPDPDNAGSGPGGQDNNKGYVPFINPTIQHDWGFTVDHNLTANQSLHYSQWRNTYHNFGFDQHPIVDYPNPLNSRRYYPNVGSAFLLNYTYSISSHLVMTAGVGWVGEINNQFNVSKLNGNTSFPGVVNEDIPPEIQFSDPNHSYTTYGTGGSNESSVNRKLGIAIVNNWLWTKGRNSFNIGAEFRRSFQNDNEEQHEGGNFTFSNHQTAQSADNLSDGNAFASFLLGLPDETDRANSQELRLRNVDFSPYFQDDIKLSPRLTLNIGLRWDMQVPFTEIHNTVVFFDPTKSFSDSFGTLKGAANKFGSDAGYNRADIHWGHIGPRLGFAYQLSQNMVVQGGFNIAFLNGGAYEYGTNKVAVNYGNLLFNSFKRSSSNNTTSSNGRWDENPLPDVSTALPFNPGLGAGTQINAFDKKRDGFAPYTQQWNLNLQRQLPWNVYISAAYVGNRIIHLPSNLNPIDQMDPTNLALGSHLADVFTAGQTSLDGVALPYPNFVNDFGGSATVAQALRPYPQYSNILNNFEGFGTTSYQGIQVEAEKRFTNGVSFLLGYTLSHSMDNISSGFSSFENAALNKYNQKPEWTVSTNDEPQTLKASGIYELPIGANKPFLNNRKTDAIFGGWEVGWLLDYESGPPIQGNNQGVYTNDSDPLKNGYNRPNRNPSVSLGTASYKKVRDYWLGKSDNPTMFNPSAFTKVGTWELGNAERMYSALRVPALLNENLSAMKKFSFGERFKGTLKVDYFNAFNRTQFQEPDNNIAHSTFGQVDTSNTTRTLDQGNATMPIKNRQGQVQFRLQF